MRYTPVITDLEPVMHLRLSIGAVAAIVTAASAAGAQGGGTAPAAVVGTAYDSLRNGPLDGALVTIAGTSLRTTTDSRGRFRFDSVPAGNRTFSVQHAALDSIGFSGISARVIISGSSAQVHVALPSFATLWRAACGDERPPRDSGFVYGTVRDAREREPVNGAVVDLSWIDVSFNRVQGVQQRRWRGQARTDETGSYSICGVPTTEGLRIQAVTDSAGASGLIDLQPRGMRVQRRDLVLGPANDSDLVRRGTITGAVTDDEGKPVPDVRIVVDEYGEVRTGADGRIVARNVPAGTRQVEAMAVGRRPVLMAIDVFAQDTATFTARMHKVTTLDVVRVIGSPQQKRFVREFEERRVTGSGYSRDSTDFRGGGRLSSVFEGLPSVQVEYTSGTRFYLTLPLSGASPGGPSRCLPNLVIDGHRTDFEHLNMFRIDEIGAVEVYPRSMSAPMQFIRDYDCGAVVVWTKFAFQ